MRGDKKAVVEALYPALKATSHFHDLKSLEYVKYDDGEEVVIATFENGYTKKACVTGDSGIAIIKDVMKYIV